MICLPLKSGLKHSRKENKMLWVEGRVKDSSWERLHSSCPTAESAIIRSIHHTYRDSSIWTSIMFFFYTFPSLMDSHFPLIHVHSPWHNAWYFDICIVYSKCLKHLSTSTRSCFLRSLFVQILSVVKRAANCIERCTGAVHGADKLGQSGVVLGAENNADRSVAIMLVFTAFYALLEWYRPCWLQWCCSESMWIM